VILLLGDFENPNPITAGVTTIVVVCVPVTKRQCFCWPTGFMCYFFFLWNLAIMRFFFS